MRSLSLYLPLAGLLLLACGDNDSAGKTEPNDMHGDGDGDGSGDGDDEDDGDGDGDTRGDGDEDGNGDGDETGSTEQELSDLDFDLRIARTLSATSICDACTNKLGYGSYDECLDDNGADVPDENDDRECVVSAYALDADGSAAQLKCWEAGEKAFASCLGSDFTCKSSELQPCIDAYADDLNACPPLAAKVEAALDACD